MGTRMAPVHEMRCVPVSLPASHYTSGVTSGSLQRTYFPEFCPPRCHGIHRIPHDLRVKKMSGIHSCLPLLLSQESQKLLDCQLGYFTVYADWAKETVKGCLFTSLFHKCLDR